MLGRAVWALAEIQERIAACPEGLLHAGSRPTRAHENLRQPRGHQPAEAYEAALLYVSHGQWSGLPNGSLRLVMVEEMLREGRRNGFDAPRLMEAALAAHSGAR